MSGHEPQITPGLAPGGLVFRVVAADGTILDEEGITPNAMNRADLIAARQRELANEYVDRTGQKVYTYCYDGDSGECVMTVVLEGKEEHA